MLNFIYYPVSFILWCWHWVFGHVFGEASGFAWALAVVFLVFTLRAILFKPFVGQVRSMRKMQEFAPELQKIKKKYPNDKQRQAQEMQKLQSEHGVNPLGGCLPMLVQIPVFIGLFHVLRSFKPGWGEVYFFDAQGVESFVNAKLFGANLSTFITMPWDDPSTPSLSDFGTDRSAVLLVAIPLMIIASIATHFTARHSVARQTQAATDNPQTAIMNKLTLYIFPVGVLVGGLFFPIAILLYWLSNNAWTLGQQYVVYHRIDREEEAKKVEVTTQRQALAPKPGVKPATKPKPGQKPQVRKPAGTSSPGASASGTAAGSAAGASPAKPADEKPAPDASGSNGTAKPSTEVPGLSPDRSPSKKQGNKKRR
ncbi:membrane protein insertase YidC [Saccharothrix sp. HUAS TT1]|uniref:membrane protein insertase YidC n=1 Tax=unclassified Saccharothrix TaxID=2593673 RepID=UPI00345BAB2C